MQMGLLRKAGLPVGRIDGNAVSCGVELSWGYLLLCRRRFFPWVEM